jgi:hypothetical protein
VTTRQRIPKPCAQVRVLPGVPSRFVWDIIGGRDMPVHSGRCIGVRIWAVGFYKRIALRCCDRAGRNGNPCFSTGPNGDGTGRSHVRDDAHFWR